jgi:hypothetical protein
MGTVVHLQVARPASAPPMAAVLGSAFAALLGYFSAPAGRQENGAPAQAAARRPNLTVASGRVRPRTLGHA